MIEHETCGLVRVGATDGLEDEHDVSDMTALLAMRAVMDVPASSVASKHLPKRRGEESATPTGTESAVAQAAGRNEAPVCAKRAAASTNALNSAA